MSLPSQQALSGMVVAIDGPSGSGKSSVSRGVAARLGLRYLDTGAQYRAMTYWMLQNKVDVGDPAAVAADAGTPVIVSGTDPAAPAIGVDGEDVAVQIREADVTGAVSAVAAVPEVRARLIALQREIIGGGGIVVEGRDIASVVAPAAGAKIFLTASQEARAARRNTENGGGAGGVAATREALTRRDSVDSRTNALAAAPGAVVVDATELTLEQVIEQVAGIVIHTAEGTAPDAASQGVGLTR
ncbi:cytidylate kinase [Catenulispora acidiphila DSM 44928]|uniref:Cytidylate kinase n=1 Tax=Catenulispora acidiphila (strain DSM 44928 / JCM 14897 / NBRC 102108 / NRRL B-24433 / ID139908) TaxID=479433 RepID=C7Q4K1_CATAD|nr:(d)CMP kinase [Catenulispora acidiphila]ACU71970.1 cytidylate kinase [Catenulispora acidiphila DSM 44928]